jgi:carboxymethylenebutenolidase
MQGEWLTISDAADCRMEGYYVKAADRSPAPTIILLQEIFGVNEAMRAVAHDFAKEGFAVLVPDLFWRVTPRIALSYSEPDRRRAGEIMREFDTELGLVDLGHTVTWVRQRPNASRCLGAVGFCLGGKLATILGARGTVDIGVSFYGVQLDDYVGEIAEAKSPLLLHFGELDTQIPLDLVHDIESAVAHNDNVSIHIYSGATHGFFNSMRPERHHPEAAARSRTSTLEALRKTPIKVSNGSASPLASMHRQKA